MYDIRQMIAQYATYEVANIYTDFHLRFLNSGVFDDTVVLYYQIRNKENMDKISFRFSYTLINGYMEYTFLNAYAYDFECGETIVFFLEDDELKEIA